MHVTTPALPPRLLPPAARTFRDRFRTTFGRQPAPEALQAYEAASAVLHAIRAAGEKGNDRARRDEGVLRDPRPRVGARPLLDRPLRRHEPVAIRRKPLSDSQFVLDKLLEVRR